MPAVLRVALPVPLPTLFDYLPPPTGEATVGSRLLVPFGRGKMVGIVVQCGVDSTLPAARLKPALQLLDDTPLLDHELMRSLGWAADYWLGAPGEAYANALPLALREPCALPDTRQEAWALSVAGQSALDAGSRRGSSLALLKALAEGSQRAENLSALLPGWREAA
ncbi:MAG: primosomal protein N', partial [Dyella sp.]